MIVNSSIFWHRFGANAILGDGTLGDGDRTLGDGTLKCFFVRLRRTSSSYITGEEHLWIY
jgi:hypothetical protein